MATRKTRMPSEKWEKKSKPRNGAAANIVIGSVLALVDGTPRSANAIRTALAVGRAFHAYVELLHVELPPEASIPVMGDGMAGPAVAHIIEADREKTAERTKEAKRLFNVHCVERGVPIVKDAAHAKPGQFCAAWRQIIGRENPEVSKNGRLFDLIVLARPPEEDGGIDAPSLDAALLETGRPVLFAPDNASDEIAHSVLVAWDGSREAARGAGAALPFLMKAGEAAVVTVGDDDDGADPADLAHHLELHGVKARAISAKPKDRKIGSALLGEASRTGAGMLVMGAYGHSALREIVFGGATREVLRTATIPVLLAH